MAEGKGHTELLPCPFCGNAPEIFASGEGGRGTIIECCTSGCVNPHTSYYGDGVAERQWNTRAAVNTYPAVEGLVKALEGARQFITNGIELGYIRMPDSDTPDPAHQRLPQIEAALSRFRSLQNGGES
jgi:hypothetical protein